MPGGCALRGQSSRRTGGTRRVGSLHQAVAGWPWWSFLLPLKPPKQQVDDGKTPKSKHLLWGEDVLGKMKIWKPTFFFAKKWGGCDRKESWIWGSEDVVLKYDAGIPGYLKGYPWITQPSNRYNSLCNLLMCTSRWWFQISSLSSLLGEDSHVWLIFFRWVETTNQCSFECAANVMSLRYAEAALYGGNEVQIRDFVKSALLCNPDLKTVTFWPFLLVKGCGGSEIRIVEKWLF